MSLTTGSGPLGGAPTGFFNFELDGAAPKHRIYFASDQRRLRALVGNKTVLDTTRAHLLHETGILPRIYAPTEDYALEFFTPTDTSTHCPFKGDASYRTLRVGDREVPDALWQYEAPKPEAAFLTGYAALYPDAPDAWLVEDDRVLGHLRDPFHRVDVRESSRHVRITANGEVVAESDRPRLLFETGFPPRAYVPEEDVRRELLTASETTTVCPYKGIASYRSIEVDGVTLPDTAWFYPEPIGDASGVRGLLSFLGDGVEVELEGAAATEATAA